MNKEVKALKQALDQLKATHERLEKAHEKFGKAHKRLEKAHSSLLNEQIKKKHVETCDVDLTYDIIDEHYLSLSLFLPLTLLVVFQLPPRLVVMVSLVMPH